MNRYLSRLAKDSVVYGLGAIAARSIGLALLPVYTRVFSVEEYGVIEMLVVLNSLLASIMSMGMDSAQSFYFFNQREHGREAQATVVTAILQWRIGWGGLVVGAALVLVPVFNRSLFAGQLDGAVLVAAFVNPFLNQILQQSLDVLRLQYRPWPFIGINLADAVLTAVFTLIGVLAFGWGIWSFFVGSAAASLLMLLVAWWRVRDLLRWSRPPWSWWPRLLKFGGPLVPAALGLYLLNMTDRWFLTYFRGAADLGLYGVAAKFAAMLLVAIRIFRQAWWPLAMDAMHTEDGREVFRTLARAYSGVAAAGAVLLTVVSPWLLQVLTAPDFWPAYPLVGVLCWPAICFGFYQIAAGGIWKAERTHLAPICVAVGAVANALLNWWLVPRYGGMGAALGTTASFLLWVALAVALSERLWSVGLPKRWLVAQAAGGLGATGVILACYRLEGWGWLGVAIGAVSAAGLLRSAVTQSELRQLIGRARAVMGKGLALETDA